MTHSNRRTGSVVALAGVLLLAACSANTGGGSATSSTSSSAGSASSANQLKVATTSAGQALTGKDGKTLYFFAKDSGGKSACNTGCVANWPPFTLGAGETATAGDGVEASMIGSITRDDGSKQVTYGGHPLYYYAADSAAGDANGQGVLGLWFIANPAGTLPSASGNATPTPTTIGY